MDGRIPSSKSEPFLLMLDLATLNGSELSGNFVSSLVQKHLSFPSYFNQKAILKA